MDRFLDDQWIVVGADGENRSGLAVLGPCQLEVLENWRVQQPRGFLILERLHDRMAVVKRVEPAQRHGILDDLTQLCRQQPHAAGRLAAKLPVVVLGVHVLAQ